MFPQSNGKILIVDDLATNRALLRGILKSQGFETDECSNGVECLSYCENELPAMVLLDIMMPELDGIQTCWHLRRRYSLDQLPIIMVTNKTEGKDLAEGLSAGANDYVLKPVDRTVLIARIANQLSISSYRRQIQSQKLALERTLAIQNAMGNALPEGVAVARSDGELVFANMQLIRWCDGTDPQSLRDVARCAFGGRLSAWLGERVGAVSEATDDEVELVGEPLCVQLVRRPIGAGLDEMLWLWLLRDLTEVKSLERRMNQRVRIEMLSVFASGIAHNFNNLFSGILGSAELLDRLSAGQERASKCVQVIKRAVGVGVTLTKRLSALVKRELPDPQNLPDLSHIIRSIVEPIAEPTKGRISVEFSLAAGLPWPYLSVDNLKEVLGNLVTNGIEAISDTGTVTISCSTIDADRLCLSVRDTGCGMDATVQTRLFEPFFTTKNLDAVNNVGLQGNGLGLWNVYHLVKMSGGTIEVESRPGGGTTVSLMLPTFDRAGRHSTTQENSQIVA